MTPRQGDIVLVPVPFTDLTSNRRRPVIVVSNDAYQASTADFVAVAMTCASFPGMVVHGIRRGIPNDLNEYLVALDSVEC